jgi:hypothetical protein
MLQVTAWQVYRRLHGGLTLRKVAVFLAVRNDAIGTFETSGNVRSSVAIGGKADIA